MQTVNLNGRSTALNADYQSILLRRISAASSLTDPNDPYGEELAKGMIEKHWGVPARNLVLTSGARSAVVALASKIHAAAVETPSFLGIGDVLRSFGVHTLNEPWESHDAMHVDTFILTSPFRNPDGATLHARRASALAALYNQVYRDATFSALDISAGRLEDPDLTFGSVGKMLGCGIRLGWLDVSGLPSELHTQLTRALGPSAIVQRAAGDFLNDVGTAAIETVRNECAVAHKAFFDQARIEPLPTWSPSCLVASVNAGVNLSRDLAAFDLELGPGDAFGCPTNMARVCFLGCTTDEAIAGGHALRRYLADGNPPVIAYKASVRD
jgi:DNA-binding transcriptional MocR family regulator